MPIYRFRNKVTGIIFEELMSLSQRDQFLVDRADLFEYVVSAPNIIDPVRLGIRKPDQGFKEVLKKIHTNTPGSILDKNTNF